MNYNIQLNRKYIKYVHVHVQVSKVVRSKFTWLCSTAAVVSTDANLAKISVGYGNYTWLCCLTDSSSLTK